MPQHFKHSFKTAAWPELALTVYNCGFQKCGPGHQWGPGVRDHYLIHYVVSGRGTLEMDGQSAAVGAGDAFLIRPHSPARYTAHRDDPWEYYWVGFSGPAAPLLLLQTAFASRRSVITPAAAHRLRRGLLDVYKARGGDYPAAVRMAGYLQAALGLLMEAPTPNGHEALSAYARQGAALIQQNFSRPITVEEVAAQVGVSRSHLYRAFQVEFQCAPSDYLTAYRMERARELLRHSPLSVGAVATSVGFEDRFYFSRVFHRMVGTAPSAYRAAALQQP